ncbi:serine O-acetyltransferase [Candidatus Electrothrix sp.]|uniref:serine O-acetyltransferase n=3 Tax=Candidatus Electrothrix sp. TaxID=2170559 RepID=UPI0040572399
MSFKDDESCGCEGHAPPVNLEVDPIPSIVNQLTEGFISKRWSSHIEPVPIPTKKEVVDLVLQAQRVMFPGYFSSTMLNPSGLEYHLGHNMTILYRNLIRQLSSAIRHDCFRHNQPCSDCNARSHELAGRFIRELPKIRETLEMDIQATLDGDPAARNADEVIFSYPGFFAVFVYRLAHILFTLDIPILPRILSEYAYHRTAIDIHPGADIGESFFIDHGAGVVVGETCVIGNRVRLYQGVTLGALSLPKGAGKKLRDTKRHPTIEDDVIVYASAIILGGDTVVGARSIVGGNVWLTKSIGPDTKVLVKQPELVYGGKDE